MSETLSDEQVVPAQIGCREGGQISRAVHMMAYEVYRDVFGAQRELTEGNCRGGFGVGELIGFLYARNFPRSEWDKRFHEALKGLKSR